MKGVIMRFYMLRWWLWAVAGIVLCFSCAGAQDMPLLPELQFDEDYCPPVLHEMLQRAAEDTSRMAWGPLELVRGEHVPGEEFHGALKASSPLERSRAAFLAGSLQTEEALSAVRLLQHDTDRNVRLHAGIALCRMGRAEGLPAASAALIEAPEWLRFYAVEGIRRVGGQQAKRILTERMAGQTDFISTCMTEALATLDYTSAATRPPAVGAAVSTDFAYDIAAGELWLDAADVFIAESDWWWHRGDYDQCIRCMETALFFDPLMPEQYSNIAWLQWSMNRHAEAISTYRRGIAANPESWQARQALALYYHLHNLRQLAIPHYAAAADLGMPPVQMRGWGHALEQAGRPQEAMQVWQRILTLDPLDPIATRQIGRLKEAGVAP